MGDYPLRERPVLARLAMECIASFATVESWMLNLYLDLAGGSKTVAADMFLKLESRSARSAALEAVIPKLEPRYQSLYRAIAKLLSERAKERDRIAHWVWGISRELSDALLLADPRILATLDILDPAYRTKMCDAILVYRENDFTDTIMRNEELAGFGLKFRWVVQGHIVNAEDQLYAELTLAPAIAEKLNRQAQQE